jgi:DNA-binding transcriptional MerR regulator
MRNIQVGIKEIQEQLMERSQECENLKLHIRGLVSALEEADTEIEELTIEVE